MEDRRDPTGDGPGEGHQPSPAGSAPAALVNLNGMLLFSGNDGTRGAELWKSDGTAAGTALVKDIRPGLNGSNPGQPVGSPGEFGRSFAVVGSMLFFKADDGTAGAELWKTDGTAAGTVLVKDIHAGTTASNPRDMVVLGDKLVFAAGTLAWASDGTAAGTVAIQPPGGYGPNPVHLTVSGGFVYFYPSGYFYLYRTDGTSQGTQLVIGERGRVENLVDVNGTLFFTLDGSLHKTDGTAAGCVVSRRCFSQDACHPRLEQAPVGP